AHEVDEQPLACGSHVEQHGGGGGQVGAVPGERVLPAGHGIRDPREPRAEAGCGEGSADEGRDAPTGRGIELRVEPEERRGLLGKAVVPRRAGDAGHRGVVAVPGPRAVEALDAGGDGRADALAERLLGVGAPRGAERVETPGGGEGVGDHGRSGARRGGAVQPSSASALIDSIALVKPPLVSEEPATRETSRVSMSLPTMTSEMPPANFCWKPFACGSSASGVTVTAVTTSSFRVSSTLTDCSPAGEM